jgi:hypothetical protein
MQKLMLAGNRLTALPSSMLDMHRLELLRISANRLVTLPDWLFNLPRLSWLAFAGNPLGVAAAADAVAAAAAVVGDNDDTLTEVAIPTLLIPSAKLTLGDVLGEGASGVIYRAVWRTDDNDDINNGDNKKNDDDGNDSGGGGGGGVGERLVAVKVFKGSVTSDGLPSGEFNCK